MTEPVKLTPRAVAVLVSLRQGPRTAAQIQQAIADERVRETLETLGDLETLELVTCSAFAPSVQHLTDKGVAWLAHHGLRVRR